MSYLAILGRHPHLSLAELESVLGAADVEPIGRHALLKSKPDLTKLGGTIKLAVVVAAGKVFDTALIDQAMANLPPSDAKLTLGLSYYGHHGDPLRLGMQLKKRLREDGRSVRLVLPKPGQATLTAAQLKFNGLVTSAAPEIVIFEQSSRVIVGLTSNYQDIDAYSARDYDRPERSGRVGMLPPKLAQILVNLAAVPEGLILDPFCGSGTILQEARLMDHPAMGSDLSPAMVKATRANMEWLDNHEPGLPTWQVDAIDARNLTLPSQMTAIVSEGYLGPALSHAPESRDLTKANAEVSELIRSFLKNLSKQTGHKLPVVLCLPQWQTPNGPVSASVIDEIDRLGYTFKQFVHTEARELVYRRPGQIVARQIVVIN